MSGGHLPNTMENASYFGPRYLVASLILIDWSLQFIGQLFVDWKLKKHGCSGPAAVGEHRIPELATVSANRSTSSGATFDGLKKRTSLSGISRTKTDIKNPSVMNSTHKCYDTLFGLSNSSSIHL